MKITPSSLPPSLPPYLIQPQEVFILQVNVAHPVPCMQALAQARLEGTGRPLVDNQLHSQLKEGGREGGRWV
jgi:hypothetical protein